MKLVYSIYFPNFSIHITFVNSEDFDVPGGLAMTMTLLWIQGGGAKTISSSTDARRRSDDSTNILRPLLIFPGRTALASGTESVSSNPVK